MAKEQQGQDGFLSCPKCRYSPMRPMKSGKGWSCGAPGNTWDGRRWTICDGVVWANNKPFFRAKAERPLDYPTIKTPTPEQEQFRKYMGTAPQRRGSRAMICDAGPGTAKTTTNCWAMRDVSQRVGNLSGWWQVAFNVNAKITTEQKLPTEVSNIGTINSFGARIQGYSVASYKSNKLYDVFKELTNHLEYDNRPKFAGLKNFVDRMRDLLYYSNNPDDTAFWSEAIAMTGERFPSEGKKLTNAFFAQTVKEYLPHLMVRSHQMKSTIDITEQVTRPVTEAIAISKWRMRPEMAQRKYKWGDDEIRHLANLIKTTSTLIPQQQGIVVDEAQDLSLSQIVLFLASSWRTGEIVFIGDDHAADDDGKLIKAGQGIFGWRGAFPGSLTLIERLWRELTGEHVERLSLSVTHRCPPEVVDAVAPLNSVLRSSKPAGSGEAWSVTHQQAWSRWINLPEGQKALWITRTNAPLSDIFLQTLKDRRQVCLRGSSEFAGQIEGILYSCAGYCDKSTEEYKVPLNAAIKKLQQIQDEKQQEGGQEEREDMDSFILSLMIEIQRDPAILREASLPANPTVGNVRRFILHFASKDAPRILSTVYRSKGDEADLVIVDDCEKFNQVWNGDSAESDACRHVAATRAVRSLLVVGRLTGVNTPLPPDDGTGGIAPPVQPTATAEVIAPSPSINLKKRKK